MDGRRSCFWLSQHGTWTFGEDGIDRGFEVAVVTNFPFEGPVATVKVGEV